MLHFRGPIANRGRAEEGRDEDGSVGEVMTNLRTVDLLEHLPHALDVVVVEEPRLAIFVVFLERNAE